MTVPEEKFISNFHALEGVTIGERRKSLFKLFSEMQHESSEIRFLSLHPKTPLEENFKVEALIYFKRIPELIDVLKSGNPILIEKVLKATWFFNEAFKNLNGEELITQIFPNISYNTKLKLLNKLSCYLNDTQRADQYFEAIKEKYGIYLASKLLPACSNDLLMKYIESYRIEITPRHLLNIIKKCPSLAESIFKKLKRDNPEVNLGKKYEYIFVYLMKYDFPLFVVLMKKYKPKFRLGARATVTLVRAQKQTIVEKSNKFYDFLKTNQIYKSFKQDFKDFYHNLLPKSINIFRDNFDYYVSVFGDMSSNIEKADTFLATARKVYGEELCDHPNFVMPKVITMMSPEEREAWMETHSKPKDITESAWISFMKIEKSVPLLKEKFSHAASIKQRANLMICLIKTCKYNNNKSALIDVLKFALQHRNDDISVHQGFLKTLNESFKLKKFQNEQWKILYEYLCFYHLNHGCFWVFGDTFEAYIFYCFEKNLPVKDLLIEWTKTKYRQYNLCKKNPKYERSCLLMFNEIITPIICKDEEELNENYIDYLACLINFNKRHPGDKISVFINNDAINCLKLNLEKDGYVWYEQGIALDCIISDYEKSKETNLLHIALHRKEWYDKSKLVNWLAEKHPSIILDYINPVMESLFEMHFVRYKTWYRNYTHLGIPQKLSEICLKVANSEEEDFRKRRIAVTVLSYAIKPKDFLKFVASHDVPKLSPDINSEQEQNMYKLHQAILPRFRSIIPASLALESMLTFCKGDYLKFVLKPLYFASRNVAENKLASFLNTLYKNAVSVRKHSVLLAFTILNKKQALSFLLEVMENDRNSSIRRSLLKAMFNYFLKNPDDYLWDLTKRCINSVDQNDEEACLMLTKCRKIPSQYFGQYISYVWNFLDQNQNDMFIEGKCEILRAINAETVSLVPKSFCVEIIEKYLFKSHQYLDLELQVHTSICKYLIYCENENDQKECMDLISIGLKQYVQSSFHDLHENNVVGRKTVFHFVKEFCSDFIAKKCRNVKGIQLFINMWNDFLKPYEAFDEYLYLHFTLMYVEFRNEKATMSRIGEKLALLCNDLHENRSLVMSIFCKSVNLFIDNFLSIDKDGNAYENKLILIEGILETRKSLSCLALGVNLLPSDALMTPKMKTIYNGTIEILMKSKDPTIQIRLNHYLRNKSDPH